jgi:hypothetical protein
VSPIPADQLEPDGARARQLRSDLVAAERQQRREHEREMQVGKTGMVHERNSPTVIWSLRNTIRSSWMSWKSSY